MTTWRGRQPWPGCRPATTSACRTAAPSYAPGSWRGFIRSALHDGDKVICCTVGDDPGAFAAGLAANDPGIAEALTGGRLEIYSAAQSYLAAGRFEVPTGTIADTRGRRASYLLGGVTLTITTLLYRLA
ncbi:hypothetical protein [Dactylosporangium sp. NPDC049140]|uniref:MEDS domain-containing protein n=1 Tax=Dactylosporangium sp. NPDC049140 TaxID=3155647 RepID=UPI0033DDCD01